MEISIASWNIEKNGKSSDQEKQTKVSNFIDQCCTDGETNKKVSIIFLCEVHSAQVENYRSFLSSTYSEDYDVHYLSGNYSNNYIILIQKKLGIQISHDSLKHLNRDAVFLQTEDNSFSIILAHFKSGQTNLTKDQLVNSVKFLQGITAGRWAITGDMNWDYNKAEELGLITVKKETCWHDETQKHGGILDWCLFGQSTNVIPWNLKQYFPEDTFNMQGPDHKPVIFDISW